MAPLPSEADQPALWPAFTQPTEPARAGMEPSSPWGRRAAHTLREEARYFPRHLSYFQQLQMAAAQPGEGSHRHRSSISRWTRPDFIQSFRMLTIRPESAHSARDHFLYSSPGVGSASASIYPTFRTQRPGRPDPTQPAAPGRAGIRPLTAELAQNVELAPHAPLKLHVHAGCHTRT